MAVYPLLPDRRRSVSMPRKCIATIIQHHPITARMHDPGPLYIKGVYLFSAQNGSPAVCFLDLLSSPDSVFSPLCSSHSTSSPVSWNSNQYDKHRKHWRARYARVDAHIEDLRAHKQTDVVCNYSQQHFISCEVVRTIRSTIDLAQLVRTKSTLAPRLWKLLTFAP